MFLIRTQQLFATLGWFARFSEYSPRIEKLQSPPGGGEDVDIYTVRYDHLLDEERFLRYNANITHHLLPFDVCSQ